LDKPQNTIFTLLMLLTPIMACAENTFSNDTAFGFNESWRNNTQDIFRSYQEKNRLDSSSLLEGIIKDKPLNFENAAIQSGQFNFDYPEIPDSPLNDYISEKNQPYSFQNSRVYKLIPKDLVPYLGLRMKYNVTSRFGLVNDITPKNIFYGLTYTY